MKTYFFAVCMIGVILYANKLNAITYSPNGTANCSASTTVSLARPCQPTAPDGTYCVSLGGDVTAIKSCTACNSGYTLKTESIGDCCNQYNYGACVGNCASTCGNNTTEWKTTGTSGHETRVYEYCTGGTTCTKKTQYRCAAGYYGRTTNGTSGCTACPNRTKGATTTPDSGNNVGTLYLSTITNCYFPAYQDIRGTDGKYQYTEPCYYSEDKFIIEGL